MGVQKAHHRYTRCNTISLSSDGKGKDTVDNPVLEAHLEDDSDNYDIIESSCELVMVEGQPCSIPYALYDLPNLTEILSLDTWNSCLTEEERFTLTAYLPDMDQHTFCLTMREILDGSNIYFGNPLDSFFRRLKGGYYPPKVSCYREGLQFLQRKKYYHSLRSYNDRMVKLFVDMRRIWDQCDNSLGVEERIFLWTKRRNQRRMNLLDLNKFPKDDHPPNEEFNWHEKGVMSMHSKRTEDNFPSLPVNGTKLFAPNIRAKGVLKVKASGNGLFQNYDKKLYNGDFLVQSQSVPKGLLKIVSKVPSTWTEQSELVSRGAQPTIPVWTKGLQDFKFSSLPALHLGDAKNFYGSAFQRQKVDYSRVRPTLDQPPCLLNQQGSDKRTNTHSDSSARKMKMKMAATSDNGISVLGKHKLFGGSAGSGPDKRYELMDPMVARRFPFSGESLWPDLVTGTIDRSLKSLESYPFGVHSHGEEQQPTVLVKEHIANNPGSVELVPKISDIGTGRHEKLVSSSSDGPKGNECTLPLTYKRRKALAKLNSSDFGKPLMAEADSKHVIPKESRQHFGEGTKVVKIKLKGWKHEPSIKGP